MAYPPDPLPHPLEALEALEDADIAEIVRSRPTLNEVVDLDDFIRAQGYEPADFAAPPFPR